MLQRVTKVAGAGPSIVFYTPLPTIGASRSGETRAIDPFRSDWSGSYRKTKFIWTYSLHAAAIFIKY
jgi:hypothetical protein